MRIAFSNRTNALPILAIYAVAMTLLCACDTLLAEDKPTAGSVVYTCAKTVTSGATAMTPESRFSSKRAGWDLAASPGASVSGACSSTAPFFFSFPARDKTYQVTVSLGGPAASVMTVKAEARKMMLLNESIGAGETRVFTFNVPARTPNITAFQRVKLKPAEMDSLSWDEKLTLEFNGTNPSVQSITVAPIVVPTIYLAGDSTVVDQDKEPWAAWGQMLPLFFTDRIAVSNLAESGETIRSFTGEGRLAKILSTIHAGDYLLVQFAHNDQKSGSGFVSIPDYKDALRMFIAQARARGATPILVTSMNRRVFDEHGQIKATLGEYPQATRDVAAEKNVGLIDLNASSKILFEALGPQESVKAFVHFPANTFPDQPKELKDDTHFNAYGAYELARAIVSEIQTKNYSLTTYLRKGIAPFDPAHPDPVGAFHLPASPFVSSAKPYER